LTVRTSRGNGSFPITRTVPWIIKVSPSFFMDSLDALQDVNIMHIRKKPITGTLPGIFFLPYHFTHNLFLFQKVVVYTYAGGFP